MILLQYLKSVSLTVRIAAVAGVLLGALVVTEAEAKSCSPTCRSTLEYVQSGLTEIFAHEKWQASHIDSDPTDFWTDKSWFARFMTVNGKTPDGQACTVTLFRGSTEGWNDYDHGQFPLVWYTDASGAFVSHTGSTASTQNSKYDEQSKRVILESLSVQGVGCSQWGGCPVETHTLAEVSQIRGGIKKS